MWNNIATQLMEQNQWLWLEMGVYENVTPKEPTDSVSYSVDSVFSYLSKETIYI